MKIDGRKMGDDGSVFVLHVFADMNDVGLQALIAGKYAPTQATLLATAPREEVYPLPGAGKGKNMPINTAAVQTPT